MNTVLKNTIATIVLPTIMLSFAACTTSNKPIVKSDGDSRRVGNVVWQKQIDVDVNTLLAEAVEGDKARIIFIRKSDNDAEQTSSNISVNNRFQVSLNPGSYTAVNSCVGINRLSAHATGFKDNDLLASSNVYQLMGGKTYFIYVDVNEQGNSVLTQITDDSALQVLQNKRYQAHQISRVTPNCALPVVATPPKPAAIVVVAPVLEQKATIDLKVLFETDKSIVRPEYYSELTEFTDFMMKYPNSVAVIEGHTDSRASDAYNKALSQRRVEAIKEVLISQFGISDDRLSAIGYGESRPIASNDNAEGRQLNRRVVAVIEERLQN